MKQMGIDNEFVGNPSTCWAITPGRLRITLRQQAPIFIKKLDKNCIIGRWRFASLPNQIDRELFPGDNFSLDSPDPYQYASVRKFLIDGNIDLRLDE